MNFELSQRSIQLKNQIEKFLIHEIIPLQSEADTHFAKNPWERFKPLDRLQEKAKEQGLWNLFLPDSEFALGLKNVEYAPLAEIMGPYSLAQEAFNCSAPDTGNMEVLLKYGTDLQKERFLIPLLNGQIRSCFAMTEPDVASSDATNMQATIDVEGEELVLNGRKWFITGFAHPHTKVCIFMGLSNPDAPRHQQHSMVLVETDSPGVEFQRHLTVFGHHDADHGGHGEINFNQVRVPRDNILLGLGRGFEIAQGRLGPGRIHHCMRAIGVAEFALELMIKRGLARTAFGRPLIQLHGNRELIAKSRIEIDQARLLTLRAASLLDQHSASDVMNEISQIKVAIPQMTQRVIDRAIQVHGACGVSDDIPLARLWAHNRTLRLADGPDEVHLALIARQEIKKYQL